jgi:FlaA1/EpsC-like NDP-sugar epimerase
MDYLATEQKSVVTAVSNPKRKDLRGVLLALPRSMKRTLQITADTLLIWASLWLAFYLRLDDVSAIEPMKGHAWLFVIAPILTIPILAKFGLYRAVMRYVGYQALVTMASAITVSATVLAAIILIHQHPPAMIPRSTVVIYWLLCMMFVISTRFIMRQYFRSRPSGIHPFSNGRDTGHPVQRLHVAVYGAGEAGNQLLMALRQGNERQAVAFIDDDPALAGRVIAGLPVFDPNDLDELIQHRGIDEVLLAIPSASRSRRTAIIGMLAAYPFCVRTIPGFMDLASGRVEVQDLRVVDISDLLGREPVQPDRQLFERCIRDKVVMVTGAGGSIGSELCRQILLGSPKILILFEHSEFNLYSIHAELENCLRRVHLEIQVIPVLNTVRNQQRLFDVMSAWKVDTVYHAAAYKHVPMVEHNIAEGIYNNVFGTLKAAQAAILTGVSNFVLISTDKAVRPTNTMGSTKRLAELVLQALATQARPSLYGDITRQSITNSTRFTMVRFGNVLGSSGSVIPLFRDQIAAGGPVTVTHPDITRYFMTIPEAAQLVIQAGAMGLGGDVFVLDMGDPIRITDLAAKMIMLSGLTVKSSHNPNGDIGIEFIGMRPGEKLYEELLIGNNTTPTAHPMIMSANETHIGWEELKHALADLDHAILHDNYPRIRQLFLRYVDGYTPGDTMVDWIYLQQLQVCGEKQAVRPPTTTPAGDASEAMVYVEQPS